MSVTFFLLFSVRFPSDPCFILQITCFLRQYFPPYYSALVTHGVVVLILSQFVGSDRSRVMRKLEGGSFWWRKILRGCTRKIILVRDLLRQAEAKSRVPLWLPVLHITLEASYTDHERVWPCYRYYDLVVNPVTHVLKGFVHFCCHELTQTRDYN